MTLHLAPHAPAEPSPMPLVPPAMSADPPVMSAAPPESLAEAVASAVVAERGSPTTWRTAPVRTGLASAVIDAIMTPRVSTSTVDAVVVRYEKRFGHGTSADLAASFASLGAAAWREQIATNHRTYSRLDAPFKSDVVGQAATLLGELGVLDVEDLWRHADDERVRATWTALPSQGSGASWRHLLLVSGYTEVVICPVTRRFARRVLPRQLAESPALLPVIEGAADVLSTTPFALEHQMWRAAVAPSRGGVEQPDGIPEEPDADASRTRR